MPSTPALSSKVPISHFVVFLYIPLILRCYAKSMDSTTNIREILFSKKRKVSQRISSCAHKSSNHWSSEWTHQLTIFPAFPNTMLLPTLVDIWISKRSTDGRQRFRPMKTWLRLKWNWMPATPMADTLPWTLCRTKSSQSRPCSVDTRRTKLTGSSDPLGAVGSEMRCHEWSWL